MNQAAFNGLLHTIGPGQITGFFLVLARLSPLFVLAPLFSSKMLPVRVRGIVAVALALGLTPVALHGIKIPTDPVAIAVMLIQNGLVGLAFAFAVNVVFAAVETAGSLIDTIAGFSYGSLIDPIDGNQGGVMTSLYGIVGLGLFIAVGGDAWTLRGIARTITVVPLTRAPDITSMTAGVESAFGSIFVAALEVAAPVLLALFITDVAFGMVSRVVPQLNVFAVGFPMKIGVALVVVGAALPFLGGFMSSQIASAVSTGLQSL